MLGAIDPNRLVRYDEVMNVLLAQKRSAIVELNQVLRHELLGLHLNLGGGAACPRSAIQINHLSNQCLAIWAALVLLIQNPCPDRHS